MKPGAAITLGLSLLLAGCWWPLPDRNVTPTEVISHIHSWNGKTVAVGGWLGKCAGYDCRLYTTKADMITVEAGGDDDKFWDAFRRGLGIGSAGGFDELAAPHQHQYVVITGRVNDVCRGFWTECFDRAPDLEPISIRLANPPKEQD